MKKFLRFFALSCLASSTAAIGFSGNAHATWYNNCIVEGGYFCAFALQSYGTADGVGRWPGDSADWGSSVDYEDSSAVNLSYTYRVKVYTNWIGGTNAYCVPKNTSRPNLQATYGVYDLGNAHTFNTGTC